jgi:hypothetical protein
LSFLADLTLGRLDRNDERRRSSVGGISRSVPVGHIHYETVDSAIVELLINTCRPLFSGGPAPLLPSELILAVSDVLAAASYKMKEQARQDMVEEDLGGGMFDEDVKNMREAAGKCNEPQVYDADELETLDAELVLHNTPAKSLQKGKTRTKLYSLDIADTGRGVEVRVTAEIRAPAEQVRSLHPRTRTKPAISHLAPLLRSLQI